VARLGFIGTGTITAAVVRGLCAAGSPPPILLSPRNREIAAALAAAHPDAVGVARNNQEVVDACDVLVLAVRPQQLEEVAGGLSFHADQLVLSFIATVPAARLRPLVAPAARVVRACPLPSLAQRLGPVIVTPPDPAVRELFAAIGTPVEVEDEAAFEVLWATTATIAPFYALCGEIAAWATAAGVPAEAATAYVAAMFHGLGVQGLGAREQGFAALVAEAQTKGGLNEQALARLRAAGVYDELRAALDAILVRLGGTPPPADGVAEGRASP
jgi:pyrroline-5-carboxylate reductase